MAGRLAKGYTRSGAHFGTDPLLPMSPLAGDEPIVRAMAGDQDALSRLLSRHGPELKPRLQSAIPERWTAMVSADDVLQEAYTRVFLGIAGLRVPTEEGFRRWLSRVAKNALRDTLKMLRANKRGGDRRPLQQRPSGEASLLALSDLLGVQTTTPSRLAARREAAEAVSRTVASLPETYRLVVRAYDLEGRPIDEVAALVGRSPGAVYMIRARAHHRLRELLQPGSGPGGA